VLGDIFVGPLIRRKAFDGIGKFDPLMFSYAEDIDLSYRLNLAGYDCIADPALILYHKMSQTAKRNAISSARKLRWGALNYLIMLLKDLEGGYLIWLFPLTLVRLMTLGVLQSVKEGSIGDVCFFLFVLPAKLIPLAGPIFRERSKVQGMRVRSDREIMGISWNSLDS